MPGHSETEDPFTFSLLLLYHNSILKTPKFRGGHDPKKSELGPVAYGGGSG
jgi:hypothetical protein